MNRFNSSPSKGYSEFREAVRTYANTEQPAQESVTIAVADALLDYYREHFKRRWGFDSQTDGACIGRIVADWDDCRHRIGSQKPTNGVACKPPHTDHLELWLSDGDAVALSMHLYHLRHAEIEDILSCANEWGLNMRVSQFSHYYANTTVHVMLYSPEWYEREFSREQVGLET